ncbi:MG2 domain-containing protein [Patescibacteria group bacterium]
MKNKLKIIIPGAIILILIVVGVFFLSSIVSQSTFAAPSSLVNSEISQGADITVTIPEDFSVKDPESVKFNPDIKGSWEESTDKNKYIFKPKDTLEIGTYYEIVVPTKEGDMKEFFEIVEPPKLVNIFPASESETHEDSKITLVFSRPMVPLTTLNELDNTEIPVEIFPETNGKFKWIGTRTLQFIPEERLIRSSNYTVKIKAGFKSIEGIEIEEEERTFITRPLRYNYVPTGELVYSNPIRISFNQPVDLERTKDEISVQNTTEFRDVGLVIEYGTTSKWNKETKKYEENLDESVLNVYQAKDKHDRSKLWNFKNNYTLLINKAYPKEGDIDLDELKESKFNVTDIVKNIQSVSERSNYSTLSFFDPEGSIDIEFFEEIDIGRSNIKGDKIAEIKYIQECKDDLEEGEEIIIYSSDSSEDEEDCEKEDNKSKIRIKYKSNDIELSEKLNLSLDKIVNTSGQTITFEPINYDIYSFPPFEIKSIKEEGSESASVDRLIVCTSTPLHQPDLKDEEESIDDYLNVNPEYKFDSWGESYYIDPKRESFPECQAYEFQTNIRYHLIPQTDYTITTKLKDVFSQTQDKTINFHSGDIPNRELDFHNLQENYTITTPDKTKLTFAVENMEYVNMEICQVSSKNMLELVNYGPDWLSPIISQTDCEWEYSERIDLEPKYWDRNYFQVTLQDYIPSKLGHYVVTFSHPNYLSYSKEKVHEHTLISISNLSAIEKEIQAFESNYHEDINNFSADQKSSLNNMYWVTDIASLEPISDATINLYKKENTDSDNIVFAKSATTNSEGIAETSVVINPAGAIINSGSDSAIIPKYETDLNSGWTAYNAEKLFIYTDRPIYKPGDTVEIKGIYRVGYDGDYEIFKDKKIPVTIFDSDYKEVYSEEIEVNEFGTFNLSYVIDPAAPLGKFKIDVKNQRAFFDVEEYVGAAFKLEAETDKEEYIAGDTFNTKINADYYFGVPLEGGEVSYSVVTQDYHFDKYTDEYFQFGSQWYYCWYECETNDTYILRGKTQINENGEAIISHKLDFDKFFEEDDLNSKIFVLRITAENTNGQQISTQKSFIVHAGEFYLGINTDNYFLQANKDFDLKVKSVDTQGSPLGVRNVKGEINKITWQTIKRKEVDGSYYYRSEKKLTKIDEFGFGTNGSGDWKKTFNLEEEGSYEISLTATDNKGNKIQSKRTIYVYNTAGSYYGDDAAILVMPSNDTNLEIVNESGMVNVGETASFMIKNPFQTKAKALIAIERGEIYEYEIVDVNQSFYNYEFEIMENYVPNVYASVVLISTEPGLKFGSTGFSINVEEKELNVTVKPDKTNYLPGETVNIEFEVKDVNDNPVEAELSLSVADLSVLALKGNPHKNPLQFFYSHIPLTVSTSANLKNLLQEIDIKPGKGGGGGVDAKKKRGLFLDTAYWQAVIRTDENGKATLSFDLPDNLTTWQLETIGVTKNTKLGVDYQEVITGKEVMLIPLKPRFIVPGDKFKLGAKVFNRTDSSQNLEVSFNSEDLELTSSEKQNLSLGSGETKTLYFDVTAPPAAQYGSHTFVLSAKNNDYEDTVEQKIPITRNNTFEATATANYTNEDSEREYIFIPDDIVKDRGSLKINTSATLAVFISDGLNSLLQFPYGCTEQIASKLDAIAIIQKGLDLENIGDKFELEEIIFDGNQYTLEELVPLGLARIYENQNSDGGFGYFGHWESNFYLTLRMVKTLSSLKSAGFNVSQDRITNAANYIVKEINYNNDYKSASSIVYAAHALNEINDGTNWVSQVSTRLKEKVLSDEKLLQEDLDNLALSHLAIVLAGNEDTFGNSAKNTVFNVIENKMRIDARGAYLPSGKNRSWSYYETDQRNTALLLKALVRDKRDNKMLGNIVRWLLNSREKDGAWGSTASTLSVVDAFTEYLVWQGENKSNFSLNISLDDNEIANFEFNPETILNQESVTIAPLNEIEIGKVLPLIFEKENNNNEKNNFYYDLALKYYLPIETIAPRDEGFSITRTYYAEDDEELETPVTQAKVGDILHGQLELIVPETRNFVAIENYLPAGAELINYSLATEVQTAADGKGNQYYRRGGFYPRVEELRDDRLFLFTDHLSAGTYTYDYYVRVLIPGEYHHLPAVINEMYFPENFGRTKGDLFIVQE